jgi:hypothetical protein
MRRSIASSAMWTASLRWWPTLWRLPSSRRPRRAGRRRSCAPATSSMKSFATALWKPRFAAAASRSMAGSPGGAGQSRVAAARGGECAAQRHSLSPENSTIDVSIAEDSRNASLRSATMARAFPSTRSPASSIHSSGGRGARCRPVEARGWAYPSQSGPCNCITAPSPRKTHRPACACRLRFRHCAAAELGFLRLKS